jgi:hypothetical protein
VTQGTVFGHDAGEYGFTHPGRMILDEVKADDGVSYNGWGKCNTSAEAVGWCASLLGEA